VVGKAAGFEESLRWKKKESSAGKVWKKMEQKEGIKAGGARGACCQKGACCACWRAWLGQSGSNQLIAWNKWRIAGSRIGRNLRVRPGRFARCEEMKKKNTGAMDHRRLWLRDSCQKEPRSFCLLDKAKTAAIDHISSSNSSCTWPGT
jgi:hypothetical protein